MNQTMKMKDEELAKKKGRWIATPPSNYKCSTCGNEPYFSNISEYKFCPFCGIQMISYEHFRVDDDGYMIEGTQEEVSME